jgi:tol-pal system protein YbgF
MAHRNTLVGIALAAGLAFTALPALATQAPPEDLRAQILRLQRDMRDLQQEVFRNGGVPRPGQPLPLPPPPIADAGPPAATMQRMSDIEESLRRLTGQLESFTHQLDQLTQKTDRLQRQLEFLESNQNFQVGGGPLDTPPDAQVPPAPPSLGTLPPAPPSFGALPPARPSLGTLPSGTAAPVSAATLEEEFDSAMNLLARAQYDRASEAFRIFADSHPDSELAAHALYWTGDIAYSTRRDYGEAARQFAELLKEYPEAPRAPESMLKLGLSLLALGQKEEGCAALAALPAKYPNAAATIANRARAERRTAACT